MRIIFSYYSICIKKVNCYDTLISTANNFNLFNTQEMYQELGKKKINASVIWGNADEIVPFDGLSYLKADYP